MGSAVTHPMQRGPATTDAWLETGLGGLNALTLFVRELEKNEPSLEPKWLTFTANTGHTLGV